MKVTSQVERREPKAGSEFVRVRLVIAEGVRSVIDSVNFQGNTAIDAETLRRAITIGAGAAILRAADLERCRQHRAAVSEPRVPRSDRGASAEGPRRRIEGGARLRHPRRAADSDRPRADRRQPAHLARDDFPRGAAQERAAAVAAAGRRDAHAHHVARPVPPRRHLVSSASRRAEPPRCRHHRRGSAGDDDQLRRRARGGQAAGAIVRERRRRRGVPGRAARILPGEPPQPVRQRPIAQPVHARQLPAERGQRNVRCESHCGDATTADTASTNISHGSPMASGAFSAPMRTSPISGGVEQAVRSSFDFNRRGASATRDAAAQPDAGRQRPLRHRSHAAAEHRSRTSRRSRRSTGCFRRCACRASRRR